MAYHDSDKMYGHLMFNKLGNKAKSLGLIKDFSAVSSMVKLPKISVTVLPNSSLNQCS